LPHARASTNLGRPRGLRARTLFTVSPPKLALLAAAAVSIAMTLAVPRVAHACGAAYPGGPVMCDFPRKDAGSAGATSATAPVARLSASYSFTSTTLLFGSGRRAELTRHAVFGNVQIPLTRSGALSLQIGAGGIAGGELVHGAARDTLGPGFAASSGVAWRAVGARGALPFVQLTATLGVTHALTRTDDRGTRTDATTSPGARPDTPRFTALDLRLGAVVGRTFSDVFTPYATARAFGGPIAWRFDGAAVTGTDLYKYQVGGGVALALVGRKLDVFAEGIAFGERGVAAGVGTTF
jgi:hypothetical protein